MLCRLSVFPIAAKGKTHFDQMDMQKLEYKFRVQCPPLLPNFAFEEVWFFVQELYVLIAF